MSKAVFQEERSARLFPMTGRSLRIMDPWIFQQRGTGKVPIKNVFDTVGMKVSWKKFKKKMGVNKLGRQQIRSTLQRNSVTGRDRETSGHLESNADQVCCFKMKESTAVFNANMAMHQ